MLQHMCTARFGSGGAGPHSFFARSCGEWCRLDAVVASAGRVVLAIEVVDRSHIRQPTSCRVVVQMIRPHLADSHVFVGQVAASSEATGPSLLRRWQSPCRFCIPCPSRAAGPGLLAHTDGQPLRPCWLGDGAMLAGRRVGRCPGAAELAIPASPARRRWRRPDLRGGETRRATSGSLCGFASVFVHRSWRGGRVWVGRPNQAGLDLHPCGEA